jgi:hypothetical protein
MDDQTKVNWISKALENESEYNVRLLNFVTLLGCIISNYFLYEKVKRYNSTQIPNSVISGNEKEMLSKHELKIKNK